MQTRFLFWFGSCTDLIAGLARVLQRLLALRCKFILIYRLGRKKLFELALVYGLELLVYLRTGRYQRRQRRQRRRGR